MNRKNRIIVLSIFSILIIGIVIYLIKFVTPTEFYNEEELLKKFQQEDRYIQIEVIQDIIHIDEKHVFVPYISTDQDYGISIWKWEEGKWRLAQSEVTSEVLFWQINENDPSTYRFAWNLPPDKSIETIRFMMVKDRGHHMSGEDYYYQSRIQMEESVPFEKTYGIIPLPEDWLEVYEESNKLSFKPTNLVEQFVLSSFAYPEHFSFAYGIYNEKGESPSFDDIKRHSTQGKAGVITGALFTIDGLWSLEVPKQDWEEIKGQHTNK